MNLQHITNDLDLTLRRRLRRSNLLQEWNDQAPVLTPSIDRLYAQIRDLDRDVAHPVLAALVDLAKAGDADAAQLVTVALLQRFADKEKVKGGTWDLFPGHLYEAIVTCHSTKSRCLREIIERNALRRNLKSRTLGSNEVALSRESALVSTEPGPEQLAVASAQRRHVLALVEDLARDRTISDTTRRILRHIAAGTERETVREFAGRSANTIRTRTRRAAQTMRDADLHQQLLDAVA